LNYILIWIFLSFLAGEVFCFLLKPGFSLLLWLSSASLLASYIFYKKKKLALSDFSLLSFFFFLSALYFKPYSLSIPDYFLKERTEVIGKITELSISYSNYNLYKIRSNYLILRDKKFYFPGSILVKDYSFRKPSLLDIYLFEGRLRKNYQKKGYVLYLKKDNPPLKLYTSKDFRKFPLRVSERISSLFKKNFSRQIFSFSSAVFLGKKEEYFSQIRKIFVEAGTCHILAISGLHVGIVSTVFLFIFKLARFKRRTRFILTIPLVLFYAFLSGARPPVLRASLMFLVYALSFLLRRKFLIFNSLALAGLIDLFIKPDDFLTVSFQLSFLAVFSISLGFRYFYVKRKLTLLEKIRILFLVSLFANLGLAGLLSFYFGKVYILNLFTNILVIPYLGLIFYSLFVFLGLSFIGPLREVLCLACSFLIGLFLKINYFFSNFPLSYLNYRFSFKELSFYYLFLLLIITFKIRRNKIPRPF